MIYDIDPWNKMHDVPVFLYVCLTQIAQNIFSIMSVNNEDNILVEKRNKHFKIFFITKKLQAGFFVRYFVSPR